MHHAWNSDREIACFAGLDGEVRSHIDAKLGWRSGDPAIMGGESRSGHEAQSSYCQESHVVLLRRWDPGNVFGTNGMTLDLNQDNKRHAKARAFGYRMHLSNASRSEQDVRFC